MTARRIRPREWALLALISVAALALGIWLRGGRETGMDLSDTMDVAAIAAAPGFPATGPADAPVTILVFSDYACPVCRRTEPLLEAAAQGEGGVRIVERDWPILGPESLRAARVALAADRQGIYAEVHDALMRPTGLDEATLRRAVEDAGGDWARLQRDLAEHGPEIDALLSRTAQDALQLGLPGTPGYLIGPIRIAGAASERQFRLAIQKAKAR